MKHEELINEFLLQSFQKNDLVVIELKNGKSLIVRLSTNKVACDLDENQNKVRSRIGVLPPPARKGFINGFENIPTPIYTETIVSIKKVII